MKRAVAAASAAQRRAQRAEGERSRTGGFRSCSASNSAPWVAHLIALLALACPAIADPAPSAPAAESTVIVISMDGVRHDYLDRAAFPAFGRIARDGLRAARLVPVYPSNTFPNHVTLATGATPAVHGIVDNRFWDRARKQRFDYSNDASWIDAEPLWAAAERQGVRAATFFWVGSETDWRGVGARYREAPFDASVGEAEKVARIFTWLDLPPAQRPRLVMTYWHGADRSGHSKGPESPAVVKELTEQDRQLGALLAGLDARGAWPHTTLLVVSDHGMTSVAKTVSVQEALSRAQVRARVEPSSSVAHVFLVDPADLARAERALVGLAGVRVDRRETLPGELRLAHPTRTGDLVVRAEPPYSLAKSGLLARSARGMHGYAPDHPDMAGIFLAIGRGVPAGASPGQVRMIDVAPTIARLLGIDPPRNAEGRAITAIAQ